MARDRKQQRYPREANFATAIRDVTPSDLGRIEQQRITWLEQQFPSIAWFDPIAVAWPDASLFACRVCIACRGRLGRTRLVRHAGTARRAAEGCGVKACTIWQPWASLIMIGAKPYEFRGRSYLAYINHPKPGERIAIRAPEGWQIEVNTREHCVVLAQVCVVPLEQKQSAG